MDAANASRWQDKTRVVVLEPYYGGSHATFVDTVRRNSRHEVVVVTLPARKWKWRMRGAAIWFAREDTDWQKGGEGRGIDVVLCNDMLSVGDLRALLPVALRDVPVICYFHENQLTYPLLHEEDRDFQYGMTNITSCAAANAIWFNSQYHMDAFFLAAETLLRKMPDFVPDGIVEAARRKSHVMYPPVEMPPAELEVRAHPVKGNAPRILWSHRWEYDKNPEPFFDALIRLHDRGAQFELVLLGEQFRTAPPVFAESWAKLQTHIVHSGFATTKSDYWRLLKSCDLIVSSAIQENFGLSVVEAIVAGCQPLLPDRLSYPELIPSDFRESCFYSDDAKLIGRLNAYLEGAGRLDHHQLQPLRESFRARFSADVMVPKIDDALADVARMTRKT